MKLHSLTADTPAACVTYHSLTVDLPLQRYFFGVFTRVSTCICIRLHISLIEDSPWLRCCPRFDLDALVRVPRLQVKTNAHTHTHTHTHTIQIMANSQYTMMPSIQFFQFVAPQTFNCHFTHAPVSMNMILHSDFIVHVLGIKGFQVCNTFCPNCSRILSFCGLHILQKCHRTNLSERNILGTRLHPKRVVSPVAYWVCAARETPIFSPKFPFWSI